MDCSTHTSELRRWQDDAYNAWERNSKRGIVKVITGAGKTYFALHCVRQIWRANSDIRVNVLVPSVALLEQWYDATMQHLNVSPDQIALYAGGMARLPASRLNVCVLNSARSRTDELNRSAQTFLVVDECHRAASPANSKALEGNHVATLGLSATPERSGDDLFETVLVPRLGPLIYEYSYDDAHSDNIVAPVSFTNVAISLSPLEYSRDRKQTKRILALMQTRDAGPEASEALRRAIFTRATSRKSASIRVPLAVRLVEESAYNKCLVFHEAVDAADRITDLLKARGHRAAAYHSRIGPAMREDNLEKFRRREFDILVACRALDEGIDVPAADVAVIASASQSTRQRIQRIGRVLRPAPGKHEAQIYTIYLRDVEEEQLFEESMKLGAAGRIRWMSVEDNATIA